METFEVRPQQGRLDNLQIPSQETGKQPELSPFEGPGTLEEARRWVGKRVYVRFENGDERWGTLDAVKGAGLDLRSTKKPYIFQIGATQVDGKPGVLIELAEEESFYDRESCLGCDEELHNCRCYTAGPGGLDDNDIPF